MYVVACVYTTDAANAGGFNLVDVVDNNARHYALPNSVNADFGGIDEQGALGGPPFERLFITQTAVHVYVPGDYHAGDTLTLTFNFPVPATIRTAALAFPLTGVQNAAVPQQNPPNPNYVVEIGNGDNYPDTSLNPQVLDWAIDLGTDPNPLNACAAISAAASLPAQVGYLSAQGTKVGELAGVGFTLAAALLPSIGATDNYEPGGAWPVGARALVGNYQFLALS